MISHATANRSPKSKLPCQRSKVGGIEGMFVSQGGTWFVKEAQPKSQKAMVLIDGVLSEDTNAVVSRYAR